jgi:hypothetical protein
MVKLRPTLASLGVLVVAGGASCLVFDGRVATDLSDGGDASPFSDAPQSSDAPPTSDATQTADATDGPRSDGPAKDAGSGGKVICGGGSCAGGDNHKCCARWSETKWVYPPGYCSSDCMHAGGGGGYYDYECDDDDECDAGNVCCAFREKEDSGNVALTTAKCQASCNAPWAELCTHSGDCKLRGKCVEDNGGDFLPPKYWYCK